MKQTIAVYLRGFVRKIIDAHFSTLQAADIQQIINLIYQTLISESLDANPKKHCQLIFETLLNAYMNKETNAKVVQTLFEQLFNAVQQVIQQQNL